MKKLKETPSSKTCSDCALSFPIDHFYSKGISPATGRTYYEAYCKACCSVRAVARDARRWARDEVYRDKRRKDSRERQQKERGDPVYRSKYLMQDCKKNDKKKGRDNDLTITFVQTEIEKPCVYCGDADTKMTLDRLDNEIGHVTVNVVPACVRCNYTRGNMPHRAWLVVAEGMRRARECGLFEGWKGRFAGD